MLSIFLALLVHFLAPAYSIGGAPGHAAVHLPGHQIHTMDSTGGPAG
jgi:hypothetical protein